MTQVQKILLIDDDPSCNFICELILKRIVKDVPIQAFCSPVEALDFIRSEYQKNPVATVLFIDINMPVLTGWEVVEELEQLDAGIKECLTIYILSSSIDPKDLERAEKSPFITGYLQKPINKEALTDIFEQE